MTSILCFELFHLFSHIIHIPGSIQTNITHAITYFINVSFLYAFYCYTNKIPSIIFNIYLLALVGIDIYAVMNLSLIYYIGTQVLIFMSLFLYYFSYLPKIIQTRIYSIMGWISIILLLILNETYNCKRMLTYYPYFPFHILIEFFGILLFYTICSTFYKL